jgi:hypothetical protein
MNMMQNLSGGLSLLGQLARSEVGQGMILTAARDIYILLFDRENGYTEVKYANEGDQIEVLGEDIHRGEDFFTVKNNENHGEIGAVRAGDLEDPFKDYTN